jgi:hypothetical protein
MVANLGPLDMKNICICVHDMSSCRLHIHTDPLHDCINCSQVRMEGIKKYILSFAMSDRLHMCAVISGAWLKWLHRNGDHGYPIVA